VNLASPRIGAVPTNRFANYSVWGEVAGKSRTFPCMPYIPGILIYCDTIKSFDSRACSIYFTAYVLLRFRDILSTYT
jgi:hypothetical protein